MLALLKKTLIVNKENEKANFIILFKFFYDDNAWVHKYKQPNI